MNLLEICARIEESALGIAIAESDWLFPTLETMHVLALTLVVGSIAMLDLRLLGVSSKKLGVMQLTEETLPWTWGAFLVAVVTGALLFTSAATRYYDNVPFRVKMVLLVLAGLNMAIFHLTTYRRVHHWNDSLPPPNLARLAGALSLVFWIGVVVFGRWIGFT